MWLRLVKEAVEMTKDLYLLLLLLLLNLNLYRAVSIKIFNCAFGAIKHSNVQLH